MIHRLLKGTPLAIGACMLVALAVSACGGGDDATKTAVPATATARVESTNGAVATDIAATAVAVNDGNAGDLVDNGQGFACPLVTTTQVSEATGIAMKEGEGQGGSGASFDTCTWNAQSGPATVSLDFFKENANQYYTESTGDGKTDVAGIGQKARWSTLSTLEVLQGNYYFAVYVQQGSGASSDDNLAAAKALARSVVESLA